MIRDSITAVVVARRHPERLSEVVRALGPLAERRALIVNLTGAPVAAGQTTVIDADPRSSLSDAVTRALGDERATGTEAVWILRDDVVPRPGAFEALASVLDTSPSVGVVGPKVMDAEAPAVIREMGESMTRSGYAVSLAERELDQAQYDRVSDVLAVGEAGMLVRREVWDALGGFDRALDRVDGALDLCCRARRAGWRVEVVPTAVVDALDSSLTATAGPVSEARSQREGSRARAHRLLASRAALLAPVLGLALLVAAGLRGIGRFVQKRPHPFADLVGTAAGLFSLRELSAARRSQRSTSRQTLGDARLFVSSAEVRRRRALELDERRALAEAAEPEVRLEFGVTAWWWSGFALLLGLVAYGPLLGATALGGGALVPMPATVAEAWAAIGATWSEVAGGITAAPDGFQALLGGLATVTWWSPNALIVGLVFVAVPGSFIAGYLGAGIVTSNTRAALVVGAAWALLPTLHIAIAQGRVTAVLAHLALPLFARALRGSTIVALGWAALLGAVVWVSVPALAPIVVLAVIIRAVAGRPTALVALVPALAFEWPRIIATISNPLAYFADRGVPLPSTSPTGWSALALWPSSPSIPFLGNEVSGFVALIVVGAFVALTVIAILVADNARVGVIVALGGVALGEWALLGGIPLATIHGTTVGLFSGPLDDVAWFAILLGAAIALATLRRTSTLLVPVGIVTVAALGVGPLVAVMAGNAMIHATTVRTLPAYVEAETTVNPGGATVVLTPTKAGIVAESQRDGGVTLVDWTAAAATRTSPTPGDSMLAIFAANIVVESGYDIAATARRHDIAFVLLRGSTTDQSVSAIGSHAGLTEVGATDRGVLWRVSDVPRAHAVDRQPDPVYRTALGVVILVALIAAVPTSLPRRRVVVDDLHTVTEEEPDGDS